MRLPSAVLLVLALGVGAMAQVSAPAVQVSPKISSLLKKAEKGDAAAQFTLARNYQKGREVGQDYAAALKWYQRSADRGEPASQCNLGRMYADGAGIARDDAMAVKWYMRSAVDQYAPGMTNLGYMYSAGRGTLRSWGPTQWPTTPAPIMSPTSS